MRFLLSAACAAILLLNCKVKVECGFSDPSCSIPGLLPFTKVAYPRFLYAGNLGGNSITAYQVNYATGALTTIGSTGVTGPAVISIHPNGKTLYSSNTGNSTSYIIDQVNGSLTLSTTLPNNSTGFLPDPSGRFGYRLNAAGLVLETYSLNGDTGGMTFVSSTGIANAPNMATMHPNGNLIYLADTTAGSVVTYAVNSVTGGTSLLGSVSLPVARGLAVDPFGRFLYATDNTNAMKVFRIGLTGLPSQIGTAPTGTFNTFVAAAGSGKFVHVTNQTSTDVSAMSVDANGVVTNVANRAAGLTPIGISVDVTSTYLYVGNAGANTVNVYSINQTSGDITLLQTIGSANGTQSFAILNELKY